MRLILTFEAKKFGSVFLAVSGIVFLSQVSLYLFISVVGCIWYLLRKLFGIELLVAISLTLILLTWRKW
jgi:hypothetical protein